MSNSTKKTSGATSTLTEEQVRKLIDSFFEGNTSPRDEQAIYSYFADGRNLPPDLESQRAMFQWFGNGCATAQSTPKTSTPSMPLRLPEWLAAITVAASLVIGCTLSWLDHQAIELNRNAYDGSFAVIDGKRETDIRKILPLLVAEQISVDTRIKSFEALAEIDAYAIGDSIFNSMAGNLLNQNINH